MINDLGNIQEEDNRGMRHWMFNRQDHGGDKLKILVLGDSNMGKLPKVWDGKVQVVCYPGAHWSNAYEILRNKTLRVTESPTVGDIVLWHQG